MSSADFSVDGLVIRVSESGDNDRLVTVLTRERGRLTFMAKGARSLRCRYMPACNPYVYATYELHAKGTGFWLREANVIESFPGIGKDIAAMYLAQYLSEVAMELSAQEEPAEDLLRLILNAYFAISGAKKPLPLIKAVFELRAAVLAGYAPELDGCHICGAADSNAFYLDVMNGGLVCASCAAAAPKVAPDAPVGTVPVDEYMTRSILMPMTTAAIAAAKFAVSCPVQKMLGFDLGDARDVNALSKAAETYLLSHLERGFSTLKTYYEVLR